MSAALNRKGAIRPEDLGRYFVERANVGDVKGLVALYEPGAVLATGAGQEVTGHLAIHQFYEQLLADGPRFAPGEQLPAVLNGDLALTSTRIPKGATAEVARRQPDGTWLWMIDRPNVLA